MSNLAHADAPPKNQAAPLVEKLAYSTAEACHALGVSETTLWRLRSRNLIRPVKALRHLIYPRSELERFLREGGGSS